MTRTMNKKIVHFDLDGVLFDFQKQNVTETYKK